MLEPTELGQFRTRAERASSVVHEVHDVEGVRDLVLSLAGSGPVAVSLTVRDRYPDLIPSIAERAEVFVPISPTEAARAAVGVSAGEAMVLETGSVLVSEHDLGDRLVSMLSPLLVQIVPAASMLRTFDEVGPAIAAQVVGGRGGYHALMTGPSRSADIERSLTVGVQGPAELHIVVLHANSD